MEKGEKPKRIHDIIELHNIVKKIWWEIDITIDGAVYLNSIYKGRYPTEEILATFDKDEIDSFCKEQKGIRFITLREETITVILM